QQEHRDRIRELHTEPAGATVGRSIETAGKDFPGLARVHTYLGAVATDRADNVQILQGQTTVADAPRTPPAVTTSRQNDPRFRRYMVSVLVANGASGVGAPVVFEEHPTLANVIGRVEHISQMGALITDFMLIKAGALHRANGGYLVVDARR